MQVENEYGSYGKDTDYMIAVKKVSSNSDLQYYITLYTQLLAVNIHPLALVVRSIPMAAFNIILLYTYVSITRLCSHCASFFKER